MSPRGDTYKLENFILKAVRGYSELLGRYVRFNLRYLQGMESVPRKDM